MQLCTALQTDCCWFVCVVGGKCYNYVWKASLWQDNERTVWCQRSDGVNVTGTSTAQHYKIVLKLDSYCNLFSVLFFRGVGACPRIRVRRNSESIRANHLLLVGLYPPYTVIHPQQKSHWLFDRDGKITAVLSYLAFSSCLPLGISAQEPLIIKIPRNSSLSLLLFKPFHPRLQTLENSAWEPLSYND